MSQQRLQLTWYNKDMALIPTETGKYEYCWVDPADPRYCETHTLVMDEYVEGKQTPKSDDAFYSERADLEPQTDNLLINGESGDVLEALTRVPELAEKYVGNVKLIYIDPPFNTEKRFESYEDNLEHSIWLTMMRDRLLNLKRLLTDGGTIWVHLGDEEIHRMRLLLDEVFGSGNFIAEIAWEKTFKPRNDAKLISGRHDVILAYHAGTAPTLNKLPRTAAMNDAYSNPDEDPKGRWTSAAATGPGAATHQGMVFAIQHPITGELIYPSKGRHWCLGQNGFLEIMKGWNPTYTTKVIDDAAERAAVCGLAAEEVRENVPALVIPDFEAGVAEAVYSRGQWPLVYITRGGQGGFRKKTHLCETGQRAIEDLWFQTEVGSNDEAKNEIKALFPGKTPFDTPKPERLLERIIHIGTNPGDIVLDCFAGSATTAAVAQKMGRRWVTCELLESNYSTYDVPRLTKVINDEDGGGITQTKPERVAADGVELPEGVSPDDATKFTTVLSKLIADDDELKKDKAVKALKKLAKTKNTKPTINWRGGGGFQMAHLSPACFDYDEDLDRVLLTPDATGDVLVRSVAANLGYKLLPADDATPFDGVRGKTFLKVYEGVADVELAETLAAQVPDGCTVTLAATGVADGARECLRRVCKGSRVMHVPDEIFPYTKGGAR